MRVDPKEFGLSGRTILELVDTNRIAIVIDRKSRIIMADGRKIVEKAEKIKRIRPEAKVMLKTTAPLCSKTVQFLAAEGIEINVLT